MSKFNLPSERKPPIKVQVVCTQCGRDEIVEYMAAAKGFIEHSKDSFPCIYCNTLSAKAIILEDS